MAQCETYAKALYLSVVVNLYKTSVFEGHVWKLNSDITLGFPVQQKGNEREILIL